MRTSQLNCGLLDHADAISDNPEGAVAVHPRAGDNLPSHKHRMSPKPSERHLRPAPKQNTVDIFRMAAERKAAVILCYVEGDDVRSVKNFSLLDDMIPKMKESVGSFL